MVYTALRETRMYQCEPDDYPMSLTDVLNTMFNLTYKYILYILTYLRFCLHNQTTLVYNISAINKAMLNVIYFGTHSLFREYNTVMFELLTEIICQKFLLQI